MIEFITRYIIEITLNVNSRFHMQKFLNAL